MRPHPAKNRHTGAGLSACTGIAAIMCLAALLPAMNASAVTLSVSNVENIQAGAVSVRVAVTLANNGAAATVGGVQMDVSYDTTVLELITVQSGTAAQTAGKSVSFNIVSTGIVRVLVSGLNQKTIEDGTLASLVFNVAAAAQSGSYPVAMTVAQMVSPTGVQITGATVPGSVTIIAAAEGENTAEGEGEGEGESGTPSGCACGTLAPPHDPGNPGTGLLPATVFLLVCLGGSIRDWRHFSRR